MPYVKKKTKLNFRRSYKQSLQHYILDFGAKGRNGRYASRREVEGVLLQWCEHGGVLTEFDTGHNSVREE